MSGRDDGDPYALRPEAQGWRGFIFINYTLGADYFAVVAFAIRESHEKGCAFLYFR